MASKGRSPTGQIPTSASSEEATRLLAEAEAFLRLGLIDKAIEHLADAVHRDPSLRVLREALVKLYVTRRQYQSAIAELWTLLSPCDDPRDEIRLLRYIIRLGERSPLAVRRLRSVLDQYAASGAPSEDEQTLQQLSLSAVGHELRAHLDRNPPATDLEKTLDIYHAKTPVPADLEQLPAAVTRSDVGVVQALAEEIALTSGTLKDRLQEVDNLLDETRYVEARKQLRALAVRYPHSQSIRARLGVLERTLPKDAAASGSGADLHAAQTLPPWANQAPVRPTEPLPKPPAKTHPMEAMTLEIAAADIQEERALKSAPPPPRSLPPPPPSPSRPKGLANLSDVAVALRKGTELRNAGQLKPAITAFMIGINSPSAKDAELSELFYEIAATHEKLGNISEAIMFYELSLGSGRAYRDAAERITKLQSAQLSRDS